MSGRHAQYWAARFLAREREYLERLEYAADLRELLRPCRDEMLVAYPVT